jgi:AcrR family transcriptional regulator
LPPIAPYASAVPRLWTETIQAHRHAVRETILDTTWALVLERGLLSITMSEIAERTGIGRATLYKYFPDVEAILFACHERQVADHLGRLAELGDRPGNAEERLRAVLEAYALISHHRGHHGTEEIGALLHRGEHVDRAQQQIVDLIRDLLVEVGAAGRLRDGVAPDELATYCLHALSAAVSLPSEAAVRRLVEVTLAGLRPQP